tara:strand:- start:968 stop:1666 length:699 start_codon:yes stop_codon:yes gene_type:complete
MAFKMKGSELYGKLNLNRNMDDTSKPDGRANSSAMQKRGDMKDQRLPSEKGPKLDSRKDYTRPVDQENVDTLTRTNRRGKQRTKDISSERADRIRGRQDMKDLRQEQRGARKDLRSGEQPASEVASGPAPPAQAPGVVGDGPPHPDDKQGEYAKDKPVSDTPPPVGSEERKKWYDDKNWAHDDTIPGFEKPDMKESGQNKREVSGDAPPIVNTSGGGYMDQIKSLGSKFGLF